jgi:MFS superfamily sulfate permease-like transporter
MTDDTESWLPYAGIGGLTVCCVALEVLGGVAVVSGLAAAIGLSTGLTYAFVICLGGLLAALLVAGYQQLEG